MERQVRRFETAVTDMSVIGSPMETSVVLALQAQQAAVTARDREKAATTDAAKRFEDMVDLKVAGVEDEKAVRALPKNESQERETERESGEGEERRRVDVRA